MIQKLTTNMMVKNVQETIQFYQNHLQFDFVMGVTKENNAIITDNGNKAELIYALMKQQSTEIMFQEQASLASDIPLFSSLPIAASVSFYFEVKDVNSIYKQLKENVKIVKDIETTWYGMREFYIADCNGYILGFASKKE